MTAPGAAAGPVRFGRYELLARLGRGGMAELCVARLVGAGGFAKLVAIKRMLPHLSEDPQFVAMFTNEANVAAQLSHPNVCAVFELGQADAADGGELFLVMELLDGVAWSAACAGVAAGAGIAAPLDVRLVAGVLAQAAEGLHYAHEHGVLHRDVSPQNLFVTTQGVCKLLDFGVAKLMTDGPRTRTGVLKGKLPYMAPEQIRGEPLDARADVFALGIVAWEALAGARLFERDSDYQIWKAVCEEPIPAVTARRAGLPVSIDDVIGRALARDRAERFATTRDFAAALAQVGGMMMPREIAEVMGATFAAHRRDFAAYAVAEPSAVSVVAERSAASTVEDRAASTVSMLARREPAVIAPTTTPAPAPPPAVARPRRRWWLTLVAAVAAGALGAVIAVAATRSSSPTSSTNDAPPAPPAAPPRDDLSSAVNKLDRLRDLDRLGELGDLHKLGGIANTLGATGTLSIDSAISATIYVDDVRIGDTPIAGYAIAAGSHHLRAVAADGRERAADVEVFARIETVAPRFTW